MESPVTIGSRVYIEAPVSLAIVSAIFEEYWGSVNRALIFFSLIIEIIFSTSLADGSESGSISITPTILRPNSSANKERLHEKL